MSTWTTSRTAKVTARLVSGAFANLVSFIGTVMVLSMTSYAAVAFQSGSFIEGVSASIVGLALAVALAWSIEFKPD